MVDANDWYAIFTKGDMLLKRRLTVWARAGNSDIYGFLSADHHGRLVRVVDWDGGEFVRYAHRSELGNIELENERRITHARD